MINPAAADLDFNIRQSCQSGEESLFSMYDKKGGNIGTPGYYKWQVCGEGSGYTVKESCAENEGSVISMFQKNDSHASVDQTYRWDVCAPQVRAEVSQECDNPMVSMHSLTDSHVAEPGYYKWQLCPYLELPGNVSFELSFEPESEVYIDGEPAEERIYTPIEMAYPYIVSDQPLGLVSYGSLRELEYREGTPEDTFRVTQEAGSSSVLLPSTSSGYGEVEDDEDEVVDRSFLDQNMANFGFSSSGTPLVKVRRKFDYTVTGFEDVESGSVEISVRNRVNNNQTVELLLNSLG